MFVLTKLKWLQKTLYRCSIRDLASRTKVCEFDVSGPVNQDVFWLDISVGSMQETRC